MRRRISQPKGACAPVALPLLVGSKAAPSSQHFVAVSTASAQVCRHPESRISRITVSFCPAPRPRAVPSSPPHLMFCGTSVKKSAPLPRARPSLPPYLEVLWSVRPVSDITNGGRVSVSAPLTEFPRSALAPPTNNLAGSTLQLFQTRSRTGRCQISNKN
jgi:hypothetical protein